ncbi:HAMP domain-containing sensor histidine kinase [Nocardia sp. BMG51109]|uniref:sensor histidine kinase n=1 Tax=Nocardia sp. BMG51109 TaxID=1056816 RepID=UPI0004660320|nr:HAMP domain-containing sensor histidine kinase [Nocardia sp. BMG51109]
MRRRLLISLTGFAMAAVLGFAIPLSLTYALSRTQQLWLGRTADTERFAALAEVAIDDGDRHSITQEAYRYTDLYGDRLLILDAARAVVVDTGVDARDPAVATALDATQRTRSNSAPGRVLPWGPDTLIVARRIGTDIRVDGAVVLEVSTARVRSDITRAWIVVIGCASLAMVLCTTLALGLSRWVLRPLRALSGAVDRLTTGLPRVPPPDGTGPISRRHVGPPEIRSLARSFDHMAFSVNSSMTAQRKLVEDTAHSMRNPLAALAIRIDSLAPGVHETVSEEYAGARAEVDRLTTLLDGLLTLAVAETHEPADELDPDGLECDAADVAEERAEAWRPAFDTAGITLAVAPAAGAHHTAVGAESLARILDVALSNSRAYAGRGAHTEVLVDGTAGRVSIMVRDNGNGVPADEIRHLTTRFFRGRSASGTGSGLGLPIAAALAEAHGGELILERVRPHGLAMIVRLPRAAPA